MALDEAIERVLRVYDKEKRHSAPTEVVAQDLGYKSANNGTALSAIASLRYFGLLERPEDGKLAVSKDVETYRYAPNENIRKAVLLKFLRSPAVFEEILNRYPDGLPSDATLRFDLINEGFSALSAESVISVFRRSAEFAGYFNAQPGRAQNPVLAERPADVETDQGDSSIPQQPSAAGNPREPSPPVTDALPENADQIPVRLPRGRRAWLVIPSPFFEADKVRLKAQIDLLLTDDSDDYGEQG